MFKKILRVTSITAVATILATTVSIAICKHEIDKIRIDIDNIDADINCMDEYCCNHTCDCKHN